MSISKSDKESAVKELKQLFNPELLNRIDEVVHFNSLSENDIGEIVDIMLEELSLRVKNRGIELSFTKQIKNYIRDNGYDFTYGARNLRKIIRTKVEDNLADEILKKTFKDFCKIKSYISKDGEVYFKTLEEINKNN